MGEADEGTSWVTRFKVLGVLLLAGALLAPLPWLLGQAPPDPEPFLWGGGIAVLFGLVFLYLGFRAYRELQLLRDTPTSKVRSLAIGTCEVQGEAHPLTEPVVSPLTHTSACMYEFTIQEYQTVEKRERDPQTGEVRTKKEKEWRTVLTLRDDVPFCIDDGTGRVPVRADEATLEFEVEEKVSVGKRDPPPGSLAVWLEEHDTAEEPSLDMPGPLGRMMKQAREGSSNPEEMDPQELAEELSPEGFDPNSGEPQQVDPEDVKLASLLYGDEEEQPGSGTEAAGSVLGAMGKMVRNGIEAARAQGRMSGKRKYMTRSTSNKRRFEEKVLAVGEETYVFGAARRLPEADSIENVENLVVRQDDTTGKFLVSDKSLGQLLGGKLLRSVVQLGAAAVFLSYGLTALVHGLSVL